MEKSKCTESVENNLDLAEREKMKIRESPFFKKKENTKMASRFLYFNYQSSDKYLSRQLWKNVQVRCLFFLDGCRLYATIVKHNFSTVKAEYEHPVSGVCAFCCLFLILFPPHLCPWKLHSSKSQVMIYKQGQNELPDKSDTEQQETSLWFSFHG